MPIKFRCQHCRQFLGISRTRAGGLVDCPTCGRTIRVPNLDGTVDPLPQPKLNVAELGSALDELASIGDDAAFAQSRPGEDDTEGTGAAHKAERIQPVQVKQLAPLPQPEPIAVEPPAPVEPVDLQRRSVEHQPPASAAAEDLPSLHPEESLVGRPPQRRRSVFTTLPVLAALLATGLVAFAAGWFAGSLAGGSSEASGKTSIGNAGQTSSNKDSGPRVAQHALPPREDWTTAFEGQVTYLYEGQSRPDVGARIIVLPATREQGTLKIPAAGFRPVVNKDNEANFRMVTAALQELGGNATLADAKGKFALRLPPSAGTFHLIAISRYRGYDYEADISPATRTLLGRFFDQPRGLIKRLGYEHVQRRFDGEAAVTWNCEFE